MTKLAAGAREINGPCQIVMSRRQSGTELLTLLLDARIAVWDIASKPKQKTSISLSE